jgi:hypothetical protein
MAVPPSYQWTPANNRTPFPVKQSSQADMLDRAAEAQRQHEQELLVWGLSIAAVFLLAVIVGAIRVRRLAAAREAARLFASGALADPWRIAEKDARPAAPPPRV